MAVRSAFKWLLGLGIVGGGVALLAGAASASVPSGPDPSKGGGGVRAGVRYEGCAHFELVDLEQLQSWGRDNAIALLARMGVTSVDTLREDPEIAVRAFFSLLFPECDGPEDATWGPERKSYAEVLAEVKAALEGWEGTPQTEEDAAAVAEVAIVALLGGTLAPPIVEPPGPPPKLPTPAPLPPMDGEGAPDGDVLVLEDADDFEAAQVLEAVEPAAGQTVDIPRTVLVGYSEGWTDAPQMLAELQQLAAENPDVEFLAFSFTASRQHLGKPDESKVIAYGATAVDPNGIPMGTPYASANLAGPSLPAVRWAELVRYAREGYPTAPGSTVLVKHKDGQGYTVLVSPPPTDKSGAWSWWVWQGPRDDEARAIAKGSSLGEAKAREHALAAIGGA